MAKLFNKETVKGIASGALSIAALLWIGKNYSKYDNYFSENNRQDTGFGAAVEAVMESDMLSVYKNEVISHIDRNETSEYYDAITSIVESDMLSNYKVEAIKKLKKG